MEKLKFYKLKDLTDTPGKNASADFTAPINPEQLSINRQIKFEDDTSGSGGRSEGSAPRFKTMIPDKLSINLILDATGVIPGTESLGNVDGQIETLNKLLYHYQGSDHRPNYIYIIWGNSLRFRGMLESIKLDYTLFTPEGDTLRAKVALSFAGMEAPKSKAKEVKKSSPDMSHVKLVRLGDRLPLMANEIYGDFDYSIEVARANGLVNFRRLEPGGNLRFPPLEK